MARYRPQTKLREGYVLHLCHSVHGKGGGGQLCVPACITGHMGRQPSWTDTPWVDTPRQTPPWADIPPDGQ